MAKENQPKNSVAATEEVRTASQKEYGKERFEFLLTVNDNIICQRNFHIHSLNPRSLTSKELYYSAKKCVEMIKNDLKFKTQVYLECIAPQSFESFEQMKKFLAYPTFRLMAPCFIVLKDTDEIRILKEDTYDRLPNGEFVAHLNAATIPYVPQDAKNNMTMFFDTVKKDEVTEPCLLKFIIRDRDKNKELICISWDGTVYPRFVRTNIDLSNRVNRYITDEDKRITLESMLVDKMKDGRDNLIPSILKEICQCCSCWSDDDTVVRYTDKEEYESEDGKSMTYYYDIEETNRRREKVLGSRFDGDDNRQKQSTVKKNSK